LTDGRVPIIGSGGIESGVDAFEKICAGASVVQFYTALVYQGFPAIGRIKRELNDQLRKNGYGSVGSAIGANHKKPEVEVKGQVPKSWWSLW
jgi:dihydroorotate dehydrogenase